MLSRLRHLASALTASVPRNSFIVPQSVRPFAATVAGENSGEKNAPTHSYGVKKVANAIRAGQILNLEGVIHILNTSNNIFLTLTDTEGKIKGWTTPASVGFKHARRRLPVAAETAASELSKKAISMGYSTVAIKIKGIGQMTQYAIQMIASSGIKITQLVDVTPVPYNGCRPKKKRRV
mmetsp:Transcript_28312/g.52135  ORF Transcript_28312/g.52135 Transcript_28312/m.52135 type:complete len:179 (-) Transcript_28312:199-735(-)|eukprot:CAMPEP_0175062318 /NCGR_PEP_ID=MMETSP0052_2-20121109/14102_1 /TAXON_ID=51329 ORGANISM="Polytomella parva, Strain SAG 63-3" /NCGR_SAMPLE_ID=MMETSP0052_2 /ASSEMBLY_ACC=CAM_ASM_000194 /LENGTH=178 /DNA_ID=CAMNT_0016328327 /DNA_START=31 /DNA_END=567 /DNA_ORIENTATION=+